MQAILISENGPHEGRRRWIRQGEQLTVGASAWADVVVTSEYLLPIHLLIDLNEDGCAAQCVSDSAFEVNGEMKSQAILNDGDKIRIADVLFRIELQGETNATALRRVDLASSILPANHRRANAKQTKVQCIDHDPQFVRFEPGNDEPPSAVELTELIEKRSTLMGLCRFDRWRFPCPEELRQVTTTVPKADSPGAIPHLPLLFPLSTINDPSDLIMQGLDSGNLILLASQASADAVLAFLRAAPGLFLSPTAMKNILIASQPGAMDAIMGPIDGIVLGTNHQWVFYCRRETFANAEDLLNHNPESAAGAP